ncbi:DUF6776 family protein [uncultured Umboniibacter sp.]|uniref:DUF6776 family protein n=1 Tax=uncultured Umboniibacter sp. TaxID=1798917 RepID=UPI0026249A4B|nr:DUF6776 family protein [uncultured Umboniibacter sp.]
MSRYLVYLVIISACLMLAFVIGYQSAGAELRMSEQRETDLVMTVEQQSAKLQVAQERAAAAGLARSVAESANQQSRDEMVKLQAEVAELSQLVNYYRSLMDSSSNAGVSFGNTELRPALNGSWTLSAMVHQVATQHQVVRGELVAHLVTRNEAGLYERAEIGRVNLSFRYFQRYITEIQLPDGMVATEVELSLMVRGEEPKLLSVEWPVVIEE